MRLITRWTQAVSLPVTLEYFRRVWARDCKHIKILKHLRFTLCTECVALRKEKSETRDEKKISNINKRIEKHIAFVRQERRAYAVRIAMAKTDPKKCLSRVTDGSVCTAYSLPHFLDQDTRYGGTYQGQVSFRLF